MPGNEIEISVRLEKLNKEFDNVLLTAKYPKIKVIYILNIISRLADGGY